MSCWDGWSTWGAKPSRRGPGKEALMFNTQPAHVHRSADRAETPITVFGTTWCADTQRVRRYLDRLSIPYAFRDMDNDPDAARRVQWWTGGSLSHPTVQVGGQVLVEPSLEELGWVLQRHG